MGWVKEVCPSFESQTQGLLMFLRMLQASLSLELPQLLKRPPLPIDQFPHSALNERLNRPVWLKRDEQAQVLVQLRR